MTTYRKIHGRSIQAVTTDPTETVSEGQIWYNTTSDTFKSVLVNEAWSSASPLSAGRGQVAGSGSQTAALATAGETTALVTTVEEYNGSGWGSGGAYPIAVERVSATGTQTATIAAGGDSPGNPNTNKAFEYDGSSWTATPNLNQGRWLAGSVGSQTASLLFGGRSYPPATNYANTETYNGSTWTAVNALNNSRAPYHGRAGTQAAAITASGLGPPGAATNISEEWDGTNWTATGNANTTAFGRFGFGSSTAGVLAGGFTPPSITTTELWDGTSWATSSASLGSAQNQGGSSSSTDAGAGVIFGGPGSTATTQEYNKSINTITAAAWSSGSLMGTGRYQGNGQNVGTQTAGMYSGGQGSYPSTAPAVTVSNVEEYDGSSWSEVNNLPESKAMFGAVGTQTAAFVFGGYGGPGAGPNPGPGGSPKSAALNYDGTNWTASPYSLPSAVAYLTGAGTSTAALSIGGHPALTTCNEYDGEGWTAGGAMTTGRHNSSAFGTQTAAIVAGGAPGASVEVDAESYNGTSWTAAADLIVNKGQAGTAGTQTDGLVFLGNAANPTNTIGWNGTSWFTQPSTSTARYGGSNGSTTLASAYYAGGGGSASGTTRQTTEEFTAESSVVTASTLTSS